MPTIAISFLLLLFTACDAGKEGNTNNLEIPPETTPAPNPPGPTDPPPGGTPTPVPTPTTPYVPGTTRLPPVYGNTEGSSTHLCSELRGPGDSHINPYRITVKGHGALDGSVTWSSDTDGLGPYGSILTTDSTLQVRVSVLGAPSSCDLTGTRCYINGSIRECEHNSYEDYTELNVTVALVNPLTNTEVEEITFSGVKVNECSPVRYFSYIPPNDSSSNLILRIKDVESNYDCISGRPYYCSPLPPISWSACWSVHLDIGTDQTNDIPR